MKNSVQFLGLLASLFLFQLTARSQVVSFGYDDAGNRTSRFVIRLKNNAVNDTTRLADADLLNGMKIIIKPNPTSGVFNVQIPKTDEKQVIKIYLHDVSGKVLFKNENCTNNTLIDISTRENGMYILSVMVNNEKRTWKIIKE